MWSERGDGKGKGGGVAWVAAAAAAAGGGLGRWSRDASPSARENPRAASYKILPRCHARQCPPRPQPRRSYSVFSECSPKHVR